MKTENNSENEQSQILRTSFQGGQQSIKTVKSIKKKKTTKKNS